MCADAHWLFHQWPFFTLNVLKKHTHCKYTLSISHLTLLFIFNHHYHHHNNHQHPIISYYYIYKKRSSYHFVKMKKKLFLIIENGNRDSAKCSNTHNDNHNVDIIINYQLTIGHWAINLDSIIIFTGKSTLNPDILFTYWLTLIFIFKVNWFKCEHNLKDLIIINLTLIVINWLVFDYYYRDFNCWLIGEILNKIFVQTFNSHFKLIDSLKSGYQLFQQL